jgi:hypothetical protein
MITKIVRFLVAWTIVATVTGFCPLLSRSAPDRWLGWASPFDAYIVAATRGIQPEGILTLAAVHSGLSLVIAIAILLLIRWVRLPGKSPNVPPRS